MRYLASSVPTGGVLALVGSIYRRNQTGTLELETEQGQKKLYFVDGQLYLRRSVVPLAAQIADHFVALEEGELREPSVALVELLRLTAEHLGRWKVTAYRFCEGFQVDADELTGPLPTAMIVMEGAAQDEQQDAARLKMMGGLDAILERDTSRDPHPEGTLNSTELALLEHFRQPTRIGDILGGSEAQSSRIVRALSRLWVLELVHETTLASQPPPAEGDRVEPEDPSEEQTQPSSAKTPARETGDQQPIEGTHPVSTAPAAALGSDLSVAPSDLVDRKIDQDWTPSPEPESPDSLPSEPFEEADLSVWQHFGLKGDPFSLTPDPTFLFQSESHAEALAGLKLSLLERRGLSAMTGEVGTGKTTLLYTLLNDLGVDFETAYIHNPALAFDELLENILRDFGIAVPERGRRVDLLQQLNDFLVSRAREQKVVVLIIDEAQNLADSTFEALRLLLNFETFDAKLLQIMLVGQPELAERLKTDKLRQIADRIAIRCHLGPLSPAESVKYVGHRLQAVGGDLGLFNGRALSYVAKKSRGVPRRINVICHNAMLYAFAQGQSHVSRSLVAEAARDLKR